MFIREKRRLAEGQSSTKAAAYAINSQIIKYILEVTKHAHTLRCASKNNTRSVWEIMLCQLKRN